MIDLHVHTTMSDGTVSPQDVVEHAARMGLRAIAITDHDTLAGVLPAQQEGLARGVEVIAGVEISCQWPTGILHVLGYFVDTDDAQLLECLDHLKQGRVNRIPQILARLRECGIAISVEEVDRMAEGGVPGRPHVAGVMVRKGVVKRLQEAFDRYLAKGAPAYVQKQKVQPSEAVRVISAAGGLPVLAHPHSLDENNRDRLAGILEELIRHGLRGIEAYCPRHTPERTRTYIELARELGLLVTGGSDFHGTNKPEIALGVFPGTGRLPYSIVDDLKKGMNIIPQPGEDIGGNK